MTSKKVDNFNKTVSNTRNLEVDTLAIDTFETTSINTTNLSIGTTDYTESKVSNDTGSVYTITENLDTLNSAVFIDPKLYYNFLDSNSSFLDEEAYGYVATNNGVVDGTNVATFATEDFLFYNGTDFATNTGTLTEVTYGARFKQAAVNEGMLIQLTNGTDFMNMSVDASGNIEVEVNTDATPRIRARTNGTNYADNSFHYALFVISGAGNVLYVDGSSVALVYTAGNATTSTLLTNPSAYSIGANSLTGTYIDADFTGDMNRVFVSSNAYTSGEITILNSFTGTDVIPAYNALTVPARLIVSSQPRLYMQATANQSLTSGSNTTALFDTTLFDSGHITYNSGIFTIPEAGLYQLHFAVEITANSTSRRFAHFTDNNTPVKKLAFFQQPVSTSATSRFLCNGVTYWDGATPSVYTLYVNVFQDSGSTLNILGATGDVYVAIIKIG